MPNRATTSSAVWIDPRDVLDAYGVLPAGRRGLCRPPAAAGAGWHLALEDGPAPRLLPLAQQIVHVGRSPACELWLDHPTVAPDHAALAVRRAGVLLYAGAAGGRTFVNGRRVEDRTQLGDYDIVLFGAVMVVVRQISAPRGRA
jgi:hypothetical protein